jgi:hypothetical protein
MIEVLPHGNGWRWQMISFCGRILVAPSELFPCDMSAWLAAKSYRSTFWRIADEIDHRMGACI